MTDAELVARGALELLDSDQTLTYEEACLLAAVILGP